jgi:hypothetical protein
MYQGREEDYQGRGEGRKEVEKEGKNKEMREGEGRNKGRKGTYTLFFPRTSANPFVS